MVPLERENLALRHDEPMTDGNAPALSLNGSAECRRQIRALERTKEVLAERPGGLEAPRDEDAG